MNSFKVSIVILNWNGSKYIFECIDSLINQSYKAFEVIFVDNNSTDGSFDLVKSMYPEFTYISNTENVGFARGMNIGITKCKGDLIMLLNTDVYLAPDYLEECVRAFDDSSVGCAAGYEYLWDNMVRKDVPAFCGTFGIKLHLQIKPSIQSFYDTFGVSGSFPIFRRQTIREIKELTGSFFDERFETGWEDTDLRFLLAFTKWKTCLVPTTKAWHVGSASAKEQKGLYKKDAAYQKRIFRNRFYIQRKYISGNYYMWNIYISLVNVLLPVFLLVFHHKSVKNYFAGYKEFLKNRQSLKNYSVQRLIKENKHKISKYIIGI